MRLHLREIEVETVAPLLPETVPLSSLAGSAYDIGIFVLGFEERVTAVAEGLAEQRCRIGTALVATYSTNRDDNAQSWGRLQVAIARVCGSEPIFLSDGDAVVPELRDLLDARPGAKVLVDISGASNPLILRLMWVLLRSSVHLTVTYAEASQYFPTHSDYKAAIDSGEVGTLELSSGTGTLESAVELSGESDPAARDCVILIPGYDPDRPRKVISFVDPALLSSGSQQVVWLIGSPHLPDDSWRSDLMMKRHSVGADATWPLFQLVSTFHYLDTWRHLDSIWRERSETDRFTVSPMGSKLQALGCSLFCHSRPDVRVVFASPHTYLARRYTAGVREVWAITFGSTADLSSVARSVGEVEVVSDDSGLALLRGTKRADWSPS